MQHWKVNGFLFMVCLSFFNVLSQISTAEEDVFWSIEGCKVVGKSADVTLSTDGHLSHQSIHFRMVSDVPLKEAPLLELNTAKFTGFDIEGTGRGFGFEMVYTPKQVSYLLHENAALIVGYQPAYTEADGWYYTYHAMFPTQKLPEMIAKLSKDCR